jgi:signal transduction histidine kinase
MSDVSGLGDANVRLLAPSKSVTSMGEAHVRLARRIEENALRVIDDERADVQLLEPHSFVTGENARTNTGSRETRLAPLGPKGHETQVLGSPQSSLATWPLVHEGHPVGVLKVRAPYEVLRSRCTALQAIADMSAALLSTAARAAEAENATQQIEEQVERKSRQLDIALGTAAHELRAPLAVTRSLLDVILERDFAPSDGWISLLERSRRELSHLLAICDTFLRWDMEVDPEVTTPADVGKVLHEVVEEADVASSAREKIRMDYSPDLRALADEQLLRVSVANLVRNALDHSPSDSVVDLTAHRWAGRVAIEVTDQGPGVAPDERERIFEPFMKSKKREAAGAGLGLFIAKRLIEAQRGSIEVFVTKKGTTFRVLIPSDPDATSEATSPYSAAALGS